MLQNPGVAETLPARVSPRSGTAAAAAGPRAGLPAGVGAEAWRYCC